MKSDLERTFETRWKQQGGPELVEEYRFHPVREWRFDFAIPRILTAFECEGGVHSGGRHTRGKGFTDDCIKYNEATALGWVIFRLPRALIENPDHLQLIIDFTKGRAL